jgi:hypothetical protein
LGRGRDIAKSVGVLEQKEKHIWYLVGFGKKTRDQTYSLSIEVSGRREEHSIVLSSFIDTEDHGQLLLTFGQKTRDQTYLSSIEVSERRREPDKDMTSFLMYFAKKRTH